MVFLIAAERISMTINFPMGTSLFHNTLQGLSFLNKTDINSGPSQWSTACIRPDTMLNILYKLKWQVDANDDRFH